MKDPKMKPDVRNSNIYDFVLSNNQEKKLKQTTLDTIIMDNNNNIKKIDSENKLEQNNNSENNCNNNHLKIRRKIVVKKRRKARRIFKRKRGIKRCKKIKKFMKSYPKIINKTEKATNINNETNDNLKSIKIRELYDDNYLNDYDPDIQNNNLYPKLNFYISCQSVSESDKDLSSASLSDDNSYKINNTK